MMDFTVLNDTIEKSFAEEVDIVWLDKPNRRLKGVYDARHFEIVNDAEVGVSELITSLGVKDDALDPPKIGEKLVVREKVYRIADKRPDAEGWAVLELELSVL